MRLSFLAYSGSCCALFGFIRRPVRVVRPPVVFGHRARTTRWRPLKLTDRVEGCGSRFAAYPVVAPLVHPGSTQFLRRKGACKKG